MQHADFVIGQLFYFKGLKYRCTDIGTRTVVAQCIDMESHDAGLSFSCADDEILLTEQQIALCADDRERSVELYREKDLFSNFSDIAKMVIRRDQSHPDHAKYPNQNQYGRVRVSACGDTLFPYSARKSDRGWIMQCYIPEKKEFLELEERYLFRQSLKK